VGGGQVRHPSKAILEEFDSEYDLHYHALDKELHNIIQDYNDPRLIARKMNREYDMTDSTEDYYTLNGRSFPYTIRESLIVTEPDQNIKIRMFNSSGEILAMHTHGHKATITHYDGIEHNKSAQITRDVYDLAPAQRNDLKVSTVDDGLHSYGEGIWIFHDHREKGITTDGMNPGGNVSAIVYKSFLTDEGIPKLQGVSVEPYFTKDFFARNLPVWQDADEWNSLGEVNAKDYTTPQAFQLPATDNAAGLGQVGEGNFFSHLITGLIAGILFYLLFVNRDKVIGIAKSLRSSNKGGQ
jgi:hypothetical protein